MDVDLAAGGDSCRRRVDSGAAAESTMDIVPREMYDSARAKIAANLRWLFAKAYGIGKWAHETCVQPSLICHTFMLRRNVKNAKNTENIWSTYFHSSPGGCVVEFVNK